MLLYRVYRALSKTKWGLTVEDKRYDVKKFRGELFIEETYGGNYIIARVYYNPIEKR